MPSLQSLPVQDLYFESLLELDSYENKTRSEKLPIISTTEYISRRPSSHDSRGRLLVCHDYKGGYTENPLSLSYTFNYWSLCNTFIYFSHHRVTIPPPGWINAAHRQGVKILGTLIFEDGAEPDCLRLVVGRLPSSPTGPVIRPHLSSTLPISPRYAISLAKLAQERGFDGYLLNFECALQGGIEQTRSLAAWISLLNTELVKRVGPHAETVWYDSVVFNGLLRWQDRLNSYNLPFFIPSTSFFTNYTWRHDYPNITAQYFLSLDSNLLGSSTNSKPKSLQDIYVGIDVWGRGSHGGGGFGCFKALEHITPDSLGLSVALFGQAWTWESEQDKLDWTWDKWWQYERDLWVGSSNGLNTEMPIPKNPKNSECLHPHEKYKSLSEFFGKVLPPDPLDLAFHTSFCPGVGFRWFIAGMEVFNHLPGGWTDVDKQTSMGDLLWPYPKIEWEVEVPIEVPNVVVSVHMEDGWNGGSSIKLDYTDGALKKGAREGEDGEDEKVAFRSFWVPIQSLSLTTQQRYNTSIIYKVLGNGGEELALDFALTVRPVMETQAEVEIIPDSSTTTDVNKGWMKNTCQIVLKESESSTSNVNLECNIGLIITAISEDPNLPFKLSLLLGQLNVFPSQSLNSDPDVPHILWVDYTTTTTTSVTPSTSSSTDQTTESDSSTSQIKLTTISWQPATSLQAITNITITSPEDPICVWNPQPSSTLTTTPNARSPWFPNFIYFNIYVCEPTTTNFIQTQSEADEAIIWIGTSGMDVVGGSHFHFMFDKEQLSGTSEKLQTITTKKFRVLVQGVFDTGEILPWEKCAYVDVTA